jgi:hypothetical protein
MSKQRNHWNLILAVSLLIVMLACSSVKIELFDNTPTPAAPTLTIPTIPLPVPTEAPPATLLPTVPVQPIPGLEGYWQDGLKVFTIAWQNDQYVVTAVNAAGTANPEILSQSWNGTSLTWTYKSFSSDDPDTLTTQSISGDRLTVHWVDESGTTGPAILRRVSSATPAYESLPYYDDFSDPGSGWDVFEDEYGSLKYENGYYSVRSIIKKESQYSFAYRFFKDPVIAVDVTSVSGPSNNNYGFFIGCNIPINKNEGYGFRVDMSGYYYARKRTDGGNNSMSLFSGDDRRASNAIHTGESTNHVVLTCAGGQLKLEVNGEVLFQESDYTFTEGDIQLGVISNEDTPTEFHFDNLSVTAP